ncbi:hypothetical protein IWX91DRAFT_327883 [Phyllosticta citricarpa]
MAWMAGTVLFHSYATTHPPTYLPTYLLYFSSRNTRTLRLHATSTAQHSMAWHGIASKSHSAAATFNDEYMQ